MMHEIDDTDRKIIEIVISYDKNPQSDDGILGKMGEVIEMDELMDRLDLLDSDYRFVKITTEQGTGSRGRRTIESTPQGRQYLRDWAAKQKK